MAYYITIDDVQTRLRRNYTALYTPSGESAVDADAVAADIEAAEADLHGYLAQRYVIPITDADAVKLCRAWALTLVEELAYSAIPGREMPSNISAKVAALRTRLQALADGAGSLGTATIIDDPAHGVAADVIVDGPDPVFTRSKMTGF